MDKATASASLINSVPGHIYHCARRSSWTRQQALLSARAWIEYAEHPPLHTDWRRGRRPDEPHRPSASTIIRLFGGWSNFASEAEFATHSKRWSRTGCLDALTAWIQHFGRLPLRVEWCVGCVSNEPIHPSINVVRRLFGGWRQFLLDGGQNVRLSPDTIVSSTVASAMFEQLKKYDGKPVTATWRWNRTASLCALEAWCKKFKRPPLRVEWEVGRRPDEPVRPSINTVMRLFGSWRRFLLDGGYDVRPMGRRWTRRAVIHAALDELETCGVLPTKSSWKQSGPHPHPTTVVKIFGSWRAFSKVVQQNGARRIAAHGSSLLTNRQFGHLSAVVAPTYQGELFAEAPNSTASLSDVQKLLLLPWTEV